MGRKTILILGGYGNLGRTLAGLMLRYSDANMILAGRSVERAEAAVRDLSGRLEEPRLSAAHADASDAGSVSKALKGVNLVVVASSTSRYAETVAREALAAGADYLDVQYSGAKTATLDGLRGEIEKAGRVSISDGGLVPGLPAAMVRHVAGHFDAMYEARVGAVVNVDWSRVRLEDATIDELLTAARDAEPLVYRRGEWGWAGRLKMDFRGEFGRRRCAPRYLDEMRALPEEYQSLRETGFYAGGSGWFADRVVMPLAILAVKTLDGAARPAGRMLAWSMRRFARPPFGAILRCEARGTRGGRALEVETTISHADAYALTAIPVTACILQYLSGGIKPGLLTQGSAVEPNRFMKDMERMGARVTMLAREGRG